jgi:hypothetical protein
MGCSSFWRDTPGRGAAAVQRRALHSVKRLTTLLTDILDLSGSRGANEARRPCFRSPGALASVEDLFRLTAAQARLNFVVSCDPSVPPRLLAMNSVCARSCAICGQRPEIHRIRESGSRPGLPAHPAPRRASFFPSPTGTGIADACSSASSRAFIRSRTPIPGTPGRGLGLSIVKKPWACWAEPCVWTPSGIGLPFYVSLPLSPGRRPCLLPGPSATRGRSPPGPHIARRPRGAPGDAGRGRSPGCRCADETLTSTMNTPANAETRP